MTITSPFFCQAQRYPTSPADQANRQLATSNSPHFIAEDGDQERFPAVPHRVPSHSQLQTSQALPCSPADSSLFPLPSPSHGLTQQNVCQKTRNPKPFLFTDVRESELHPHGVYSAPFQGWPWGWSSLATAGWLGGLSQAPLL